MILGSYQEAEGAFITGLVYFRAVRQVLEVLFLVDTGAAHSYVSLADLSHLRRDVRARIPTRPRGGIRGVGGITPSFNTSASIVFQHDDGEATLIAFDLPLLLDVTTLDLPSVLGRDVLFRGPLRFEPADGAVYFDAPRGSFVI